LIIFKMASITISDNLLSSKSGLSKKRFSTNKEARKERAKEIREEKGGTLNLMKSPSQRRSEKRKERISKVKEKFEKYTPKVKEPNPKSKAFAKPKAKLGVKKVSPEKKVTEGEYSFFSSSPKSSENGKVVSGNNTFFKRSYDTEKEVDKKWLMS